MDFGNNYVTEYFDFDNRIIKLKDGKICGLINFTLYDNIVYNTSISDYKKFNEVVEDKSNLYSLDNTTNYFNNTILEMFINDINLNVNSLDSNNNIDKNLYNINNIKKKIIAIPVFDSSSTKYICVFNFDKFIAKCLLNINESVSSSKPSNDCITQLISFMTGVKGIDKESQLEGYTFNLIKSIWCKLQYNITIMLKNYQLDNFKFNLGNLIYALISKFPDFYIIFKSSTPYGIKYKNFVNNFSKAKNKTERGKILNTIKNKHNLLLKDIVNDDLVNLIDKLNINKINKDNTEKTILKYNKSIDKFKKKYIKPEFINLDFNKDKKIKVKKYRKDIHSICNYITGSKHCYYSGYKDMISDFDNFNIKSNKNINGISSMDINDDTNDNADTNDNDDTNDNVDTNDNADTNNNADVTDREFTFY